VTFPKNPRLNQLCFPRVGAPQIAASPVTEAGVRSLMDQDAAPGPQQGRRRPFAPNQEPASLVMTAMPAIAYWQLPRNPPGK
jgi:hypothetical protein